MKLSDFVKVYALDGGIYAYYHSLRMIPVYISESEHNALQSGQPEGVQNTC